LRPGNAASASSASAKPPLDLNGIRLPFAATPFAAEVVVDVVNALMFRLAVSLPVTLADAGLMAQSMLGDEIAQVSATEIAPDDGPPSATGTEADCPEGIERFFPTTLREKSVTATVSETGLLKEDNWTPSPRYPASTW
jgi:hypothetical protein